MNTTTACPVCHTPSPTPLIELNHLPIYCNLLWSEQQAARDCPKGDIHLVFCDHCGAITNRVFNPALLGYSQDYENSLHYSGRFQAYAQSLAERLVAQHDLKGKQIIEIGCGKGDFLVSLCQLGNNTGVRFDNSYVKRPEHAELEGTIEFVKDFYSEKYRDYQGDFVCCRQVLEHIQKPADLLQPIRDTIGDRTETAIFFEVPNALYTFQNMMIWDIIYEHCTYFTPTALQYVFTANGYRVARVAEEFGGQFLSIEAYPAGANAFSKKASAKLDGSQLAESMEMFESRFNVQRTQWQKRLTEMVNEGKKIVIWGAGSKGVTFLNLLNLRESVEFAVDINPRKQNKFIPGTGQKIVAPDYMVRYQPDIVIVMNPLYTEEIKASLLQMGLTPQVLTTESLV